MLLIQLVACSLLESCVAPPADNGDTSETGDTSAPAGLRGAWAWRDSGDPNGTDAVVGSAAAEAAMVDELLEWGVTRVYGSYGDRPVTEASAIGAWNAQLHAAGIESHVLMGDPAWISSREWASMFEKIDDRLLAFNAGRADPLERFDGLHLDIEPQGASDWSTTTDADRHSRLGTLLDTFHTVRVHLDGGGGAALPVEADLPVWFDNLPPALGGTGSIAWPTEADRDAWFAGIGAELAGVSLMAYERDTEAEILSAIASEEALFPGTIRVGLNEEVGTTWPTIGDLFTMAGTLEDGGRVVDLHAYASIRGELPP